MDHILDFMKRHDIPITRENYLDIAYLGAPPDELDAETEADLPVELQLPEA